MNLWWNLLPFSWELFAISMLQHFQFQYAFHISSQMFYNLSLDSPKEMVWNNLTLKLKKTSNFHRLSQQHSVNLVTVSKENSCSFIWLTVVLKLKKDKHQPISYATVKTLKT